MTGAFFNLIWKVTLTKLPRVSAPVEVSSQQVGKGVFLVRYSNGEERIHCDGSSELVQGWLGLTLASKLQYGLLKSLQR